MSGDLDALIARVEAATSPDRELDLALATALVPDVLVLRQRDDDSGADPYTYWEYTGSIDASLGLVERLYGLNAPSMLYCYNLNWHASAHAEMSYVAVLHLAVGTPPEMQSHHGQARTQPLAIIHALLKSLQTTIPTAAEGEDNG